MFHICVYHRNVYHKGGNFKPYPGYRTEKRFVAFLSFAAAFIGWLNLVGQPLSSHWWRSFHLCALRWTRSTSLALGSLDETYGDCSTSLSSSISVAWHHRGGPRHLLLHLCGALRHLLGGGDVDCCLVDFRQQFDERQLHPLVLGAAIRVQRMAEKDSDLPA